MKVTIEINTEEGTKEEKAEKLFIGLMNKDYTIIEEDGIKRYLDEDWDLFIYQNNKKKEICFDYYKIWTEFKFILGDNYQEIRSFLNDMVERHLKLHGFSVNYVNKDYY